MKNAKNIQEQLENLQSELKQITVEGASGGGLVKVKLDGNFTLLEILLDPIAVDNRDVPMLQDLIRSAHADAIEKLKEAMKEKLGPLASMAGIGGLPF
ncbi:YbaB/EbfC family nucleoid-associated protein [Treponema phagedenis]|nr:YbaB/EbfC family nucleoid-associated protein [Treponema phagedenis]QEJ99691.1 YbaB/EbfC family nucleoid-associated protein [Treponema phagedenis]QEK02198.1 YbaB/EbfC family nucleoid-associated protein [Treponema phagedenis]QEK05241.1 YbaB/EbfC family nucleoid-associated protein [Treponema phagedenis]QEK07951.1 YbaB/EbfC family nucleoid-associated protein [Treponema phagedenis]